MATLKELADRTGYSPATISRILSGDPSLSVTAEARRKVLEEAGRLNYTATRSRRGRSPKGLLRVGVAEMLTPVQQLDDPYYLYLSNFLRQNCLDRKYTCIPLESRGEGFWLRRKNWTVLWPSACLPQHKSTLWRPCPPIWFFWTHLPLRAGLIR